jgi:hypothetical protein
MQMIDITKHPLLKQAYELCQEIEKLPASELATWCSVFAHRLLQDINTELTKDAQAQAQQNWAGEQRVEVVQGPLNRQGSYGKALEFGSKSASDFLESIEQPTQNFISDPSKKSHKN